MPRSREGVVSGGGGRKMRREDEERELGRRTCKAARLHVDTMPKASRGAVLDKGKGAQLGDEQVAGSVPSS
jgi:hypothetical protein